MSFSNTPYGADDMWSAASGEVEQAQSKQAMAYAMARTASLTPMLYGATGEADLDNRLALVAGKLAAAAEESGADLAELTATHRRQALLAVEATGPKLNNTRRNQNSSVDLVRHVYPEGASKYDRDVPIGSVYQHTRGDNDKVSFMAISGDGKRVLSQHPSADAAEKAIRAQGSIKQADGRMKMSQEHQDLLAEAIRPIDTEHVRDAYRQGKFPRADKVNDVDTRYRWDLYHHSGAGQKLRDSFTDDEKWSNGGNGPYTSAHIDSALKRIVPTLGKTYKTAAAAPSPLERIAAIKQALEEGQNPLSWVPAVDGSQTIEGEKPSISGNEAFNTGDYVTPEDGNEGDSPKA